ncbi:PEP-CTERM sorting domain-containing protein [Luteolibacter algae]|uniref:PEP-CTERM sorting domain-containing protein n=1 Tax=Luteolibacter algae TaxID=454151 RepID=A0ABW5D4H4_9BACT
MKNKFAPILGVSSALALTSHAAVIEFTSPDYANGSLDSNSAWNAQAGWNVADVSGVGNINTTTNTQIAVYNSPVKLTAGQSFSYSVNLQFSGTFTQTTTTNGFSYLFLSGLKADSTATSVATGGTAADANIQVLAQSDSYRLLNNFGSVTGSGTIGTGQLNGGDILKYDYSLTLGADAASTTYSVRLQNLTDGTDTGLGTITGVDASIYTALTGTGAYSFVQSISPTSSGFTGVQVNSFETVPEPSSIALLGLGGLALLGRRRR